MDPKFAKRVRSASSYGSSPGGASPSGLDNSPFASTSSYTLDTSVATSLQRDDPFTTLSASPRSGRKANDRNYSDRFIPSREGLELSTAFHMLSDGQREGKLGSSGKRKIQRGPENDAQRDANKTFNALLKSEMFGPNPEQPMDNTLLSATPTSSRYQQQITGSGGSTSSGHRPATPPRSRNLFSFSSPSGKRSSLPGGSQGLDSPIHDRYSISPIRNSSQQLLLTPRKTPRNLSKVPYKVLDAPELADDFYLNLVDWSSSNILGVGLGTCVYLWSAYTSQVTKLCDYTRDADHVTSLSWIQKGNHVAVGTDKGLVQIWDAEAEKLVRTMRGHSQRVGSLAWNDHILSSGSRDRHIFHRDVRIPEQHVKKLSAHKHEVCGLKWNSSENQLASGGNDNKLFVWNGLDEAPMHRFSEHTAAVKAIAWNPHQHGILASGGGTQDKKIRFWNTLTGALISEVDTGSQVCNLMWSYVFVWCEGCLPAAIRRKNSSELVSTHGFSLGTVQNQVCIWRWPSLSQVATLTGHTFRVLYLAMSPDGQTIVTGAGDETLRFWHAFPKIKAANKRESSALNLFSKVR